MPARYAVSGTVLAEASTRLLQPQCVLKPLPFMDAVLIFILTTLLFKDAVMTFLREMVPFMDGILTVKAAGCVINVTVSANFGQDDFAYPVPQGTPSILRVSAKSSVLKKDGRYCGRVSFVWGCVWYR